jgi:hypothetical protein
MAAGKKATAKSAEPTPVDEQVAGITIDDALVDAREAALKAEASRPEPKPFEVTIDPELVAAREAALKAEKK